MGWDNNKMINLSNSISKIDLKSQSISNSWRDGLSHAEDCIQKDIMNVIDGDLSV
jgi:hypothetical protein